MWFLNSLKVRICGLAVAMCLVSSMASASTVATFLGVTPNGSNFDFTYAINLTTGMTVDSAAESDFFQIVDILGYQGATWTPLFGTVGTNWTVGTIGMNVVPTNGLPAAWTYLPDSATIPNVLVTYIAGPAITNGSPVDMPLGTLVITSDSGQVKRGWMVGSDTQIELPVVLNGSNFTACPVPVPTPAAAWAGLGLFALLAVRKVMR